VRKSQREYFLKSKYGLTIAAWEALFEGQGRACAICCSKSARGKAGVGWCTDHDHETGEVRGIICQPCNLLVGWIEKSACPEEIAVRVMKYLNQARLRKV
jgi:hypothetical protein